jgi:hypothetical protein
MAFSASRRLLSPIFPIKVPIGYYPNKMTYSPSSIFNHNKANDFVLTHNDVAHVEFSFPDKSAGHLAINWRSDSTIGQIHNLSFWRTYSFHPNGIIEVSDDLEPESDL